MDWVLLPEIKAILDWAYPYFRHGRPPGSREARPEDKIYYPAIHPAHVDASVRLFCAR
jgi:hypothetical protein